MNDQFEENSSKIVRKMSNNVLASDKNNYFDK